MKKIKLIMAATAFFIAAAFTVVPMQESKASMETEYHWFDSNTNAYLGTATIPERQQECGTPGQENCADAYTSVDQQVYVTSTTKQ